MDISSILLPGDEVTQETLRVNRENTSKSLNLGPGLHYEPPSTITASVTGSAFVDSRKHAAWLESNGTGRYVPSVGDLVLAIVHHSSVDYYHCTISPHTSMASLPQLAFEGATKKTRPVLQTGSLVYARISMASKHMDPELECVHPSTGKADGLGELKGGMIFEISLGMARRLLMKKPKDEGGIVILEELGERGLRFEIAVGRNGRVWVNGENVKTTLVVGKALQDTDIDALSLDAQIKLVKKLMRGP